MKKIFLSIITVSLLLSCGKRLDVKPRQSIDFGTALSTPEGVSAAVNSVYAALKSTVFYGRDLLAVTDALADIGFANGKSGRLVGENRNQQGSHLVLWAAAYSAINECNLILEALPTTNASQAQKDIWEGQVLFVRALLHFELVKTYAYIPTAVVAAQDRGGVVIRTKSTSSANAAAADRPSRAPINDVYAQIISDLNTAIAKLPTTVTNVAYGTRGGAQALLSRVALYRGDYATAITQATNALQSTIGTLTNASNYVAGWRAANHPEAMFQIVYATPAENIGVNTSLQTTYTGLAVLGDPFANGGGFGDFVPVPALLQELTINYSGITTFPPLASSFNAAAPPNYGLTRGADVRAQLFEWGTNFRGTRFVECTKFFGRNGTINLDNVPVIRKSEMLLNRAEAYYRRNSAGDQALALADLNTFRANRGLSAVTLTGTALLNEIMLQRKLEFAFEGHRFWDLKRTGSDIIKAGVVPSAADLLFTDTRLLAGIPQGEIDGNPNMQQNAGY